MGMIERISEIKANMRKKQDRKLVLQSKAAEETIKHETFKSKARSKIAKAKKMKREGSALHQVSQRMKKFKEEKEKYNNKKGSNEKKESNNVSDIWNIGKDKKGGIFD